MLGARYPGARRRHPPSVAAGRPRLSLAESYHPGSDRSNGRRRLNGGEHPPRRDGETERLDHAGRGVYAENVSIISALRSLRRKLTPSGNRGSLDTEYRQPNLVALWRRSPEQRWGQLGVHGARSEKQRRALPALHMM